MMTSQLLELISSVAVILITAFLIPWLKAKISSEQWSKIVDAANKAVEAAEKYYEDMQPSEERQRLKKEYALVLLRNMGIVLTSAQEEALITSACYKLDQGGIVEVE